MLGGVTIPGAIPPLLTLAARESIFGRSEYCSE